MAIRSSAIAVGSLESSATAIAAFGVTKSSDPMGAGAASQEATRCLVPANCKFRWFSGTPLVSRCSAIKYRTPSTPLFSNALLTAASRKMSIGIVQQHLMKVGGEDDSGAAAVGGRNLLSERSRRKSARSRIQLRVDLLQGGDVVGEDRLVRPDERILSILRFRRDGPAASEASSSTTKPGVEEEEANCAFRKSARPLF